MGNVYTLVISSLHETRVLKVLLTCLLELHGFLIDRKVFLDGKCLYSSYLV
jgi:hypothetical protein